MEDLGIERSLVIKLKGLTQIRRLPWHFEGDTKKVCVAFYRDTRLKLFPKKMEMVDHNGDTAILDALGSEALEHDFDALVHVARKAAGDHPTCEVKAINSNTIELYRKLLQD